MSDSNRIALRYVKESTFGTTPASPTLTLIRETSEDLRIEPQTVVSAERRSDRQTADLILVNQSAAGSIGFEKSYKSQDWMIGSVLQGNAFSSEAEAVDNGGTIQLAISSNVITSSGGTGYNWTSNGFGVGEWVRLTGWTTNAGTIYAKISAATTTTITLTHATLANETGPTNATVTLAAGISNGTTFDSYSIQREYADLASEFVMFTGMSPNTYTEQGSASGIVTGTCAFIGKTEASATSAPSGFTNAASAGDGNDVLNATSNVPLMYVAGASFPVRSFSISITNNLAPREQVGTLGAVSLRSGSILITGSIEAYYTSKTEYDKLVSQTATDFALGFTDNDGNGMLWSIPRAKYSRGGRQGGGKDSDAMLTLDFTAIVDSTEGITARYSRWDA